MSHNKSNTSMIVAAMVIGSLVTIAALSVPQMLHHDSHAQDGGPAVAALDTRAPLRNQDLGAAQDLSSAFRKVAEVMRPSVVSINTTQTQIIRGRQLPRGMEQFFGVPNIPDQRREASGMGSGVIVRPDGYILTNNHVVENADELEVEFSDGRTVPGKIIGTDPQSDLAVVKVDLQNLPAVPMGDSDAIQVGDWVLAIGSPFGLEQTVTAGIISGKNRVQRIIDDGDGFEDFLQTDAAINPGNSGGPLVNLRGELMGINTAIMSRSGTSAGIGFAIPVSIARPVLNSIIEFGVAKRGFLGAGLDEINERSIAKYGLKMKRGVVIENVLEDMPADKAGLREGDVVVSIDGRAMKSSSQMRNYVASRPPGATLVIDVSRAGQPLQVRVLLSERTEEVMAQFGSGEVLGAELVPMTPTTAKKFGYREDQKGLVVTSIKVDSEAEQAELKVGDVIEAAGGIELDSVQRLRAVLEAGRQQQATIRVAVRRGDQRMLLFVEN
ncbi:Do family serine endopeptidase [Stieleria varia]|uniref:Periplasmic serine endoprotease DegP n=1 Tax=Stieleria varia TaxID=2528005 RepID=A0A5C6B5C8_9BACT|nr:Do family serine endopeptidase [Stieleria varia]TWU06476.1 Periplasmic serine endoprotease DegP precursor [Stieleria varia]